MERQIVQREKKALWDQFGLSSANNEGTWHEALAHSDIIGRCFLPPDAHCASDTECGPNLLCVPGPASCTCKTVAFTQAELAAGRMHTLYQGVCGRATME